jgi:GNAT superfamily N-acetyltransferase
MEIYRATLQEIDSAYRIVSEYYEAVGVVARDDHSAFEREYFGEDAGIWLAVVEGEIIGCIGLHALPQRPGSGEIKRLYVQSRHRGLGVAEASLKTLEAFAARHGYLELYLDSKDDLLPAIRFYQRHGYQPCARYNNNPQATVFMSKRLA